MDDDDENLINVSLTEIRMDILEIVVKTNGVHNADEVIRAAKLYEDYVFKHPIPIKEPNEIKPTTSGLLN